MGWSGVEVGDYDKSKAKKAETYTKGILKDIWD
jgi:hypothetical protein